jgi:hypothetical protein
MRDLAALLQRENIRSALIVDDAFDQVPTARDLAVDTDEWTQFFEDADEADRRTLESVYPGFEGERADRLRESDAFISALWQNAGRLRAELVAPLFARYRHDTAEDLRYLETLQTHLTSVGLDCGTAGRRFSDQAADVDLICIDLFLGSAQSSDDIDESVEGVAKVSERRGTRPPLVILMSRSPRLEARRAEFRDRAGLFESAFRIISKADLVDPSRLKRVLTRLASHYKDSLLSG